MAKALIDRLEKEKSALISKFLYEGRFNHDSAKLDLELFHLEMKYLPCPVNAMNLLGDLLGFDKLGSRLYKAYCNNA